MFSSFLAGSYRTKGHGEREHVINKVDTRKSFVFAGFETLLQVSFTVVRNSWSNSIISRTDSDKESVLKTKDRTTESKLVYCQDQHSPSFDLKIMTNSCLLFFCKEGQIVT